MEMCNRNDSTQHQPANNNDCGAFTRDMQILDCITYTQIHTHIHQSMDYIFFYRQSYTPKRNDHMNPEWIQWKIHWYRSFVKDIIKSNSTVLNSRATNQKDDLADSVVQNSCLNFAEPHCMLCVIKWRFRCTANDGFNKLKIPIPSWGICSMRRRKRRK